MAEAPGGRWDTRLLHEAEVVAEVVWAEAALGFGCGEEGRTRLRNGLGDGGEKLVDSSPVAFEGSKTEGDQW